MDNGNIGGIVANGAMGGNEFTLDGAPNRVSPNNTNSGASNANSPNNAGVVGFSPPSDAISEFKVQTNAFDAQSGHTAGATVNLALKSGTNAFHGAGWDYLRNTSLNAVGYFKPALGKPIYQQNQFGGALGGRIIRNKTFFFVDYEGLRRATKSLSFQTIPTLDQRNGVSNLWSQPIDGSPPQQLTNFKSGRIFQFAWSADGKWLALARGTVSSDVVMIKDFR